MSEVNIVIPSYKRSHRLLGKDYFLKAKYVIPESQRDDYFSVLKDHKRIVAIPDDQDGNIAKKRNWILKNIPRPLLMIDDDVRAVYKVHGRIRLTPDQAVILIENGFEMASDLGCVLWGLLQNLDPLTSKAYLPFNFRDVTLGPFQGHLKHDLLNDERMGTKDDYDFALQVLNKFGKIFRNNMYAYYCDHGNNEGGIVSMRTMQREIWYCRAIEHKWGRNIIKYPLKPEKMADLLNGSVTVPIKGV